jgi:hypothetical protein
MQVSCLSEKKSIVVVIYMNWVILLFSIRKPDNIVSTLLQIYFFLTFCM